MIGFNRFNFLQNIFSGRFGLIEIRSRRARESV